MDVLLFVGLALIGVTVAWLGYRADKKRREALLRFALSKGWRYLAADDSLVELAQGTPFGEGDHRRARNVLTGTVSGFEMVAFDYSYQTHSSDSKGNRTTTTHRYAVASLSLPAYLPTLQVTGESLLHRAGQLLGFDDIELESDEFNRRFNVSAADRKFATDVLTPRTMQALLAAPTTSWRIEGPRIVAWDSGRLEPLGLLARLSVLTTVIAGVPSFVWRDYGASPVVPPQSAPRDATERLA